MSAATSPRKERCSFCEKSRPMVKCLLAGLPHIYICDECVELCNQIVAHELDEEGKSPETGKGIPNAPRLGMSVLPDRLRVVNVIKDGPAARAGILVDDVLDHDVKSVRAAIADAGLDGQVVLNVRRGDTVMALMVNLNTPGPGKEVQL